MEVFQRCLASLGEDIDPDEIECLFATCISKGTVKGYVSHAHRTVVLAKHNAFPPVRK